MIPNKKKRKWIVMASWSTGLGISVAVSVFLGLKLGIWLDEKLSMTPFFLILGVGTGLVLPFYGIFRRIFWKNTKK